MTDRAATDRVTVDDVLKELNQSGVGLNVLPNLPPIPGYHVCWLSTTNTRDNPDTRKRLGYTPVRWEDVPNWEFNSLKSGSSSEGLIVVNEMVAYKVPEDIYRVLMKKFHHEDPMDAERSLDRMLEVVREQARAKGITILEGEQAG